MLVVCPYTPQASWAAARTFKTASADSQDIATALVCEVSLIFARLGDLTIFSQFSLFCLILSIICPAHLWVRGASATTATGRQAGERVSGFSALPLFQHIFLQCSSGKRRRRARERTRTSTNLF